MAKIITMINYKGGVGKTTSVFNLSTGLNFLSEKKVLMIDLDPQCSLTTLCLKAYSRNQSTLFEIGQLGIQQTINSVFKKYLLETRMSIKPKINLDELILKKFYCGYYKQCVEGIDLIPATMFDNEESSYSKGLDDLEIEIAAQQVGSDTLLNHITIMAKFFKDTEIDKNYDFIIFDCPPSNNIITQNALLVSDYFLIPTIMDDMSSNGIAHLCSLIENTIFGPIINKYSSLVNGNEDTYLRYIKKGTPKLLGIFETLRKSTADTDSSRRLIRSKKEFAGKLFKSIIYNHIDTARTTGDGFSCYSVNIERSAYSPHICYSSLVEEVLQKTNSTYDPTLLNKKKVYYL